jgi:cytochrome P450
LKYCVKELSGQRYLKAVVKEGMRLFPPAIGNIR